MEHGDTMAVLMYRTSGPQGKVKRRLQDLRIPSSCLDCLVNRPALDLSHNESARLAVDCLLNRGLEGFHQVLKEEGEVNFLSELETRYILENGSQGDADADADKELGSPAAGCVSSTCLGESTDSDCTLAEMNQNNMKDLKEVNFRDPLMNESSPEVFFPSGSTVASMKDLVRHVIRKAQQAVAIVMDTFSDVELLCDLLEASRKRNVSVHLLLDRLNLNLFVGMWQELKLNSKDFPKLSVRCTAGEMYCTKTGMKLPGQMSESFIIVDWTEVLTGSFSFSWLCWQVHRSFMVLLKGGTAVVPFLREFHRLYSSSTAVVGFVTFITLPDAMGQRSRSHTAQRNDTIGERISYPSKAMSRWLEGAAAATFSHSLTEPDRGKAGEAHTVRLKPSFGTGATCIVQRPPVSFQVQTRTTLTHSHTQPISSNIHSQLARLSINATEVRNGMIQECEPPSFQKTKRYQFREKGQQDTRPDGLPFQQRVRNLLTKPFGVSGGLGTQTRQWNGSLGFKSKMERASSSSSSNKPPTSSQLSHFTRPRRARLELQRESHPSSRSSGSRAAPAGPPLSAHRHSDERQPRSSSRPNLPFRRLPLEQTYGWSPLSQRADGARALERQSSLSVSRTAGQPAWRLLTRSKSVPERRSEGFRRGERHLQTATNLRGHADDWTH